MPGDRYEDAALAAIKGSKPKSQKADRYELAAAATLKSKPAQPISHRDRLKKAIQDTEAAGYSVPHFIGTPDEPEGDRAPTMDMESLVAALRTRESAALKAGDRKKADAVKRERQYWENEVRSGMTAQQWKAQTGEDDPVRRTSNTARRAPARTANVPANPLAPRTLQDVVGQPPAVEGIAVGADIGAGMPTTTQQKLQNFQHRLDESIKTGQIERYKAEDRKARPKAEDYIEKTTPKPPTDTKDPWVNFPFTRQDYFDAMEQGLSFVRIKGTNQRMRIDAAQRQVESRLGKDVARTMTKKPEQVEREFHEAGFKPGGEQRFGEGNPNAGKGLGDHLVDRYMGATGLTEQDAPYAAAALRFLGGLGEGANIVAADLYEVISNPSSIPGKAKEFAESLNVFDPKINGPERFTRFLNAAFTAAGAKHSAGLVRDFAKSNTGLGFARSLGVNPYEAAAIIEQAAKKAASNPPPVSKATPTKPPVAEGAKPETGIPVTGGTVSGVSNIKPGPKKPPPGFKVATAKPKADAQVPQQATTVPVERERTAKIADHLHGPPGHIAWNFEQLRSEAAQVQKKGAAGPKQSTGYQKVYPNVFEREGGYWVETDRQIPDTDGVKFVMRPALAEDFAPGTKYDANKILKGLIPPLTETVDVPVRKGDSGRQFDRVRQSAEGEKFLETRVDPKQIEVYPGLQYKKAGVTDAVNAVTDDLKGVSRYDHATAGPLTVWQTKDGRMFVMNGHHRRELAIRTGEKEVPVRVFREEDGVTFKKARAYGALQNIRDGKGTAIDAATVLRDMKMTPEKLSEFGLNTKGGIARDAISLLKLDADSLRMVEDGLVKESVAAGIADAGLDAKRQRAVMRVAEGSGLETRSQGAILAQQARNAPMVDRTGGTGDLFGEFDESLALAEQAKLADNAMRRLAQSQRALQAFDRAKAVGSTYIDKAAQSQAAAIQEFGRRVIGTDQQAAKVLQEEATKYARNPSRKQLEDSTTAIVRAAEDAAERRLRELDAGGVGRNPDDGSGGRAGSRSAAEGTTKPRNVNPSDGSRLVDVDPELKLEPEATPESKAKPKAAPAPKPDQGGMFGEEPVSGGLFEMDSPSQDAKFGKNSERIKWKSEPGGFDGQLSDLVFDIGDVADREISQGKRTKKGAAGTYYPGTAQAAVRNFNDLDTATHEIAHGLDDKFGLVGDWAMSKEKSPFDSELQWFWERGGSGGPDKPLVYNRAEGVAEFIRAYLINPEEAVKRAPEFTKHMLKVLPNSVVDKLNAVGQKLRQWHGSDAVQKTQAAIRTDKSEPPSITDRVKKFFAPGREGGGFATSGLDMARMLFTDEMAPFVTAVRQAAKRRGLSLDSLRPSNNPVTLARGLAYFPQRFESVIEFGMTDKTGNVVTPPATFLLRSLDRTNAKTLGEDLKGLEALLVSERVTERARHIAEEGMTRLADIEKALNDRMNKRLEQHEARIRRTYEAEYQQALGAMRQQAKTRRAEGKGLSATEHNRRNKRIDSNLAARQRRLLEKQEREIQAKVDALRQKELELLKQRMEMAARAVEKSVQGKQAKLTGAGGGLFSASDIANETITELQKDPSRFARLSTAASAYRDWADAVLRYMVEKGRISQASYDQIKAKNQQYAAMQRFLDDAEHIDLGNRSGMAGAKDVVKEFTGSTATIDSPLANLLRNTFAAMKEADRNEVMASFAKLLSGERRMYQGETQNLAAIGQRVDQGTKGAVRIFIKGEPQYWLFEEGIDKAIRGMGRINVPHWTLKGFQFLNNALRKGVTVMPSFQVRNRIRDTEQTLLVSPHNFKPADWLKRASSEERRLYDFFGGGIGRGHYLDNATDFYDVRDRIMQDARLDKSSIILDPRRLAESYEEALKRSEMTPRIAEIRAAERDAAKKLKSIYDRRLYAAQSARNLIDFAQGGTVSKHISRYISPFFNAQIQGQRSLLNMAADHPKKFAVRWMTTVLVPHLAVYAWNRAQGDENLEEYRQLPAYQRDMFYNLKVGPDLWVRIPKPFEAGVVGSGIERAIDKAFGNEAAFEGYGGSLAKSFLPFDEGMLGGPIAPISEALNNRDTFKDKPIVPHHEDILALELRDYNKDASRMGIAFQDALGIDARKADFLVRGFLGEAGQFAIFVSDLGRDDKPMRTHAAANRVFGTFAGSPALSSPVVNEVMDVARQAGVPFNPLGKLIDDYFDAETDKESDEAARALRDAARSLKAQYQHIAKGQEGALKWKSIRKALAKSPYKRPSISSKPKKDKPPSDEKARQGLGLPSGKKDPLGLSSVAK